MDIELLRVKQTSNSTLGSLQVGGRHLCHTLEDGYRETKEYAVTRIPKGEYKIVLRKVGGMHEKYARRFGGAHRGMLWLRDVPAFEYIYMHIGNDVHDSSGCILLGKTWQLVGGLYTLQQSKLAYQKFYAKTLAAADAHHLSINIIEAF